MFDYQEYGSVSSDAVRPHRPRDAALARPVLVIEQIAIHRLRRLVGVNLAITRGLPHCRLINYLISSSDFEFDSEDSTQVKVI